MKILRNFLVVIPIIIALCLTACGDNNESFKSVKTEPTQSTVPSSEPNLDQPCSLVDAQTAATLLKVPLEKINEPDVTEGNDFLKCRYDALSDDNELFIAFNIYIFKSKDAFDRVNSANDGKSINTELDGGFSYIRANKRESERFVGAYQGDIRIGISASIALTQPKGELKSEQIILPSLEELATQVGLVISKL